MEAVVIARFGGPEVLEVRDVPMPEPRGTEVRVRVRSAGLNRADLLQRLGRYPAPAGSPQDIPGLEFAGEVESCGPDARRWIVGERVYGICGGGAQAEYVVVDERAIARTPAPLATVDAGGVPEAFITAHDALFTQAGLAAGETALIHAVGSGVGTAAVQLAHAAGARTIGTSRTSAKLERARSLGLDVAMSNEEFMAGTGTLGANVVVDVLGGAALARSLAALAPGGRIVLLSSIAGDAATVSVGLVLRQRARISGSVMRSRSLAEKIAVTRAFDDHTAALFAAGRLRPVTDRVFPLREVRAAHEYLHTDATFGKVVLTV